MQRLLTDVSGEMTKINIDNMGSILDNIEERRIDVSSLSNSRKFQRTGELQINCDVEECDEILRVREDNRLIIVSGIKQSNEDEYLRELVRYNIEEILLTVPFVKDLSDMVLLDKKHRSSEYRRFSEFDTILMFSFRPDVHASYYKTLKLFYVIRRLFFGVVGGYGFSMPCVYCNVYNSAHTECYRVYTETLEFSFFNSIRLNRFELINYNKMFPLFWNCGIRVNDEIELRDKLREAQERLDKRNTKGGLVKVS